MKRIVDFVHIKLSDIKPPEIDHRLGENEEDFQELVDSIKIYGILLPLILKKVNDHYEVIAGHRRYQAAKINGHEVAPCTIVDGTNKELEFLKLHENLKRKDLSDVDQGYTFIKLHQEFDLTEENISHLCGKSIAYVSQHMSLVCGDSSIMHAVANGAINFSVSRSLNHVKNEEDRHRLLKYAVDNGCSVEVADSWAHEANRQREEQADIPKENQKDFEPPPTMVPVYPCFSCNTGFEASQLRYVRFCPSCHNLLLKSVQ